MVSNRARQFMPFDALKGFKEALRQKEKIKVVKKELTQDNIDELNYKFTQIKKRDIIKVIYYNGEDYVEIEGIISSIDYENRILTVIKTKISFDDIYEINSKTILDRNVEF